MSFGKDSAPTPPDFERLAKKSQESNLDMARMGLAANRVNQETPFGSLQYTQTGTDQWGHPTYTATQKLSPEQQAIYEKQTGLTKDVLGAAQSGMGNVYNSLMQGGVDQSKLAQTGINPGETYSDAIMRRLQPQMQMAKQSFESQMANQGIAPGTEAYSRAKTQFDQAQNDQLTSAITGGINVGLQANQQGFNQARQNLMSPIDMVNALRTGSGITNANYVNPTQMANVQGVDYMGAGQNQYNANLAQVNANNAASAGFMGGLMNMGGSLLGNTSLFGGGGGGYVPSAGGYGGSMTGTPASQGGLSWSDKRLKTNIEKIGSYKNGLSKYSWTYIWGENAIGAMADEVQSIIPNAVKEINGFLAVDYSLIGE